MLLFSLKVIMVVLYVVMYVLSLLYVHELETKMNFKMTKLFGGYWIIVLASTLVGIGSCTLVWLFVHNIVIMWVIDILALISLIWFGVLKYLMNKLFSGVIKDA